ncbi:calmodulin-binding transcription activator 2-like isoform X1 [Vespula squamosa]|uniref:Calmodulin-binding transcription activator 2-like isoform X1 n=1 Tax=Vespula squamosa TaxID=30214 RepID=A0ABD2AQ57_VESSQ
MESGSAPFREEQTSPPRSRRNHHRTSIRNDRRQFSYEGSHANECEGEAGGNDRKGALESGGGVGEGVIRWLSGPTYEEEEKRREIEVARKRKRDKSYKGLDHLRMRQVVVLEPAGSVLVIRQTSLSGGGGGGGGGGNNTNNNGHEGHTLANHVAVSSNASKDHNKNRIVVVRSSSTRMKTSVDDSTSPNRKGNINVNGKCTGGINCKTSGTVVLGSVSKSAERNDHLRNDHKNQEGIVVGGGGGGSSSSSVAAATAAAGESNSGCRPRTSKDAVHENVAIEKKFDGADPISDTQYSCLHTQVWNCTNRMTIFDIAIALDV